MIVYTDENGKRSNKLSGLQNHKLWVVLKKGDTILGRPVEVSHAVEDTRILVSANEVLKKLSSANWPSLAQAIKRARKAGDASAWLQAVFYLDADSAPVPFADFPALVKEELSIRFEIDQGELIPPGKRAQSRRVDCDESATDGMNLRLPSHDACDPSKAEELPPPDRKAKNAPRPDPSGRWRPSSRRLQVIRAGYFEPVVTCAEPRAAAARSPRKASPKEPTSSGRR
jgi:hypothetical protein